jgi:hypothetical protein
MISFYLLIIILILDVDIHIVDLIIFEDVFFYYFDFILVI